MAATSFAPGPARARAPGPVPARPPYPPLPRRRQPLLRWPLVAAAAAGAALFVVALVALTPHRRHQPVVFAEDTRTALVAAEPAPAEAPAPEPPTAAPAPTAQEPKAPEVKAPEVKAPEVKAPDFTPVSLVNLPEPNAGKAPACQQYGTAVDFFDNPADAVRKATREQKLLFVLHVAGNFEEPGFT